MAIFVPGKRSRKNSRAVPAKRSAVAVLQLTAMVDMFTVIVVFLLQSYATTDQILPLPEAVEFRGLGGQGARSLQCGCHYPR